MCIRDRRVCDALAALAIPHALSEWGYLSVSIGVVAMLPHEDNSAQALLRAADLAMYQAKKQGRNRVVLG